MGSRPIGRTNGKEPKLARMTIANRPHLRRVKGSNPFFSATCPGSLDGRSDALKTRRRRIDTFPGRKHDYGPIVHWLGRLAFIQEKADRTRLGLPLRQC